MNDSEKLFSMLQKCLRVTQAHTVGVVDAGRVLQRRHRQRRQGLGPLGHHETQEEQNFRFHFVALLMHQ